ncbi:MAG: class B sortase [Lachnospiraceae bacterium]|nr:class B sortase [Lachnospiraceae bacterium]
MAKEIRKWAALSLSLICIGVAAYFCGRLFYAALEYQRGDELYEKIAETAVTEPVGSEEGGESDESPAPSISASVSGIAEESEWPEVNFTALQEINPEIVAWLYCPDTVINYPVVHGEDNEYYLTHLVNGTSNSNGCLFIDCRNSGDFSDGNTVIYGHHMASGRMFASLVRYANQAYYEAHPIMYLSVEGKTYLLELFAGYTTTEDSSAYRMQFDTSSEFALWLKEISEKSDFTADIKLTAEDRIVTLSTCAYSFENARYVVHGRLVELDEASE